MDSLDLAFAPMIAPWLLGALAVAALIASAYAAWLRARGWPYRAAALAALLLLLLNPAVVQEEREPVSDVLAVVVDRSPSQDIAVRERRTDAALAALREKLRPMEALEVRVIEAGGGGESISETKLFGDIQKALADVPARRRAGAILITDGQIHDLPEANENLRARLGPVHTLLTGEREARDRRLVLVDAPRYGIVGKDVSVTFRVEQQNFGEAAATIPVRIRRNGETSRVMRVKPGRDVTIDFPIDTGGQNVMELAAEAVKGELTPANNKLAVLVNGVRDKLRVLLVSGQPHNGERTWRNLLKSDPSVELVHFTILRPPDKQDGTPTRELSLIAFPIRELFEIKLYDFDLIIFDSYRRHGVLPEIYLRNISEYVLRGGALLEANGLDFASSRTSLYYTPLGGILPGSPSGDIARAPFKPAPTDKGFRHPVTAELPGLPGPESNAAPAWGRWLHQVDVSWRRGNVLLEGIEDRPLLLLDRVGEGRVAQLTSDHIWLWSRGYDGGGPQAEMLRRLAHWLMKEPELEENRLTAKAEGRQITVRRRSLQPDPRSIQITTPSANTKAIELQEDEQGWATGRFDAEELGLYRFDDGEQTTYATVGRINPPELMDVRSTGEKIAPIAKASGGGIYWLAERGDDPPPLRRVGRNADATGAAWIGIPRNGEYIVTGIRETSLMPVFLALALGLGAMTLAWQREGQ